MHTRFKNNKARMKQKVTVFITAFCLSLCSISAYSQTDLSSLINYALAHNREIKKASLQEQEASYMRKEARGHGLPQVEGSASYSKMMLPSMDISMSPDQIGGMLDMIINESADATTKQNLKNQLSGMMNQLSNLDALYSTSAGIQVTQLIYSQAYWASLKTTKKAQELYSVLKTKKEEDVIADVANTYYQTGSLMLQAQSINKSLQNLKELYQMVELSYKHDLTKETNVDRLKVTISNLEVTQQMVKNGIDIQLNYLKVLAGMPADSSIRIDTAAIVSNFELMKEANNFSTENVASYQALIKQSEVYEQQIKLSNANFYPTLAAYAQFNYSSYSTTSKIESMSNMNTFGVSLKVPIFTSGTNYYKVKQSKIKLEELNEDIQQTKDLLTVNYNNAYLEYLTSSNMLASQKENRDLALKVYKQTSLQFQEGMASMADLLNVNQDFLQADNSYNQQILKCKTAEIKMLQASGNLKLIANKK